jgi:hypothetical protein
MTGIHIFCWLSGNLASSRASRSRTCEPVVAIQRVHDPEGRGALQPDRRDQRGQNQRRQIKIQRKDLSLLAARC